MAGASDRQPRWLVWSLFGLVAVPPLLLSAVTREQRSPFAIHGNDGFLNYSHVRSLLVGGDLDFADDIQPRRGRVGADADVTLVIQAHDLGQRIVLQGGQGELAVSGARGAVGPMAGYGSHLPVLVAGIAGFRTVGLQRAVPRMMKRGLRILQT